MTWPAGVRAGNTSGEERKSQHCARLNPNPKRCLIPCPNLVCRARRQLERRGPRVADQRVQRV